MNRFMLSVLLASAVCAQAEELETVVDVATTQKVVAPTAETTTKAIQKKSDTAAQDQEPVVETMNLETTTKATDIAEMQEVAQAIEEIAASEQITSAAE